AASRLAHFAEALREIVNRQDVTPHAKAAWAGHHVLATRPFARGNARLARLLINWVLRYCGVPFPVVLLGSAERQAAWRGVAEQSRPGQDDSQPLAALVAAAVAAAWEEVERRADRAVKAQESSREDKAIGFARSQAREGECAICLDSQPDMMVLCCGAAFHFACMARWFAVAPDPACPACRSPMTPLPPEALQPPTRQSEATLVEPDILQQLRSLMWLRQSLPAALSPRAAAPAPPARAAQPPRGASPPVAPAGGLRCAFCGNLRATGCPLLACGRCCVGNQRLRGQRCPRHPPELTGRGLGHRDGLELVLTDDEDDDALGPAQIDLGRQASQQAGDRCAFCANRRAAHCALRACSSCCRLRTDRCERHREPLFEEPPDADDLPDAGAALRREPQRVDARRDLPGARAGDGRRGLQRPVAGDARQHLGLIDAGGTRRDIQGVLQGSRRCSFCHASPRSSGCLRGACRDCCFRRAPVAPGLGGGGVDDDDDDDDDDDGNNVYEEEDRDCDIGEDAREDGGENGARGRILAKCTSLVQSCGDAGRK
ncbi:unnamed protein product, partial [Prorocentrum cordatum]